MPRDAEMFSSGVAEQSFTRVMADVGRAARPRPVYSTASRVTGFSANPMAGAAFPLDDDPEGARGGAANWRAAADFVEEADEPAPAVEAPVMAEETPDQILADLGLRDGFKGLTEREISRLRRVYMWRNHPDRHRESQRERATRRVAIANMLLDRAQSQLARGRPA